MFKIQSLIAKTYILLIGIGLVSLISVLIVVSSLRKAANDTDVINVLGRQRMLSQAMAKNIIGYVSSKSRINFIEQQVQSLNDYVSKVRQEYTKNIVPAVQQTDLVFSMNPSGETHTAIPFPATFMRLVNEEFGKDSDLQAEILAEDPINPEKGLQEEMDKLAGEFFKNEQGEVYSAFLEREGKLFFRFYTADIASVQACADCHSGMKGQVFKQGDLLGIRKYTVLFSTDVLTGREIVNAKPEKFEVSKNMFYQTLIAFRDGGKVPLDKKGTRFLTVEALNPEEFGKKLAEVERSYETLQKTAQVLLKSKAGTTQYNKLSREILGYSDEILQLSEDLVQLYTQSASKNQRNILISVVISGALILLAMALFGLFLRNRFFQPIRLLQLVTREIASGDLTRRITVTSEDEIGNLGKQFNVLAENLQSIIEDIDQGAEHLKSSTDELLSGTTEMSIATGSIARELDEESGSLQEINEHMKEIAAANKVNSQQVLEIQHLVFQSEQEAEQGGAIILKTNQSMIEIEESSRKIEGIVRVITEISNQSNLLSLNASIEAAKAGELGKGFAVVANEVGTLAQRSNQAIIEIRELIESSSENVQTGMLVIQDMEKHLAHIIQQVGNISLRINEITEQIKQQDVQVEQIVQNVMAVSNISENNASSANELSGSAEMIQGTVHELSSIALQLNQNVGRFKI